MGALTLFEKMIAASGLSPVFAKASVARALARASLKPETLSPDQIKSALPELEKMLRIFLPEGDVTKRLADIRRLGSLS